MPTPNQVKTVKLAQKRLGLNDDQYRTLLRSAGGVGSCKDLDNRGLEDVMAVMEDLGIRRHPAGPTYWRDKVAARGVRCGERMAHKVRTLAAGQERYPLSALVTQQSGGRTQAVEDLTPQEAWKLIEALKAIVKREAATPR